MQWTLWHGFVRPIPRSAQTAHKQSRPTHGHRPDLMKESHALLLLVPTFMGFMKLISILFKMIYTNCLCFCTSSSRNLILEMYLASKRSFYCAFCPFHIERVIWAGTTSAMNGAAVLSDNSAYFGCGNMKGWWYFG
jgi:hypothetical protein